METVKGRLIEFLASQRITKAEFCRKIGVSGAYVDTIRKSIPSDKILSIAKEFPELNMDWLLFGKGEMKNVQSQIIGNDNRGVIINGHSENNSIDNRQYYSDSPDVLRAQIEILDERIKEKDAQIKEKDAQIKSLLDILKNKNS